MNQREKGKISNTQTQTSSPKTETAITIRENPSMASCARDSMQSLAAGSTGTVQYSFTFSDVHVT